MSKMVSKMLKHRISNSVKKKRENLYKWVYPLAKAVYKHKLIFSKLQLLNASG